MVGTDPNDRDSNDDGILDGAAAQAGTVSSPLLRTGLIASVQLPGNAQDVCAINDVAAVALGSAGVAICNIFTRMNPIVIGLVDTPGDARRVAGTGTLLAVADGPAGLTVVDFSDPPRTPIVHRVSPLILGGDAQSVAATAGFAFVGLSTGDLVTVDLRSGTWVDRVHISAAPIADVVVAGDALYAVAGATLHALALRPGRLTVGSAVPSPVLFGANLRVFAGGGVAYAVHPAGVNTFSLANPLQPVLIRAGTTAQRGWKHLVVNGSGLALGAVSPNSTFDGPHEVNLYDARDPAEADLFLAQFETPGVARAVALFNGLCYAADDTSGLQVINYLAQDRLGIAPTASLSTNQPRIDGAEEGALLRISTTCADDVQVRSCELFVDGVKLETDGTFPYDAYLITPRLADRPEITVRVRVSDTGGNSTFSPPLVIRMTADATVPLLTGRVPAPDAVIGTAGAVGVFTTEPLQLASLAPRFTLTEAGPDRTFGTSDDLLVPGSIDVRTTVRGAFLTPAAGLLAPGRYRATIAAGVTDPTGNPLAPTSWSFTVYGTSTGSDQDGDGLPDLLEVELGLDPNDQDSDDDGLLDGAEDRDGDGVPNLVEVVLGFDLTQADSDGDGVLDRDVDRDFDRVPDAQEVALGTNPFSRDTDGDGYMDIDEIARGSDPLDAASLPVHSAIGVGCVLNRADPQATLGRVLLPLGVLNEAAPDAVLGRAIAPPTSVRNDH